MKTLEELCQYAAVSKRYWPFLDAHVKLWFIMDKLGKA
jgi:hypothetical protein